MALDVREAQIDEHHVGKDLGGAVDR